MSEAEGIHLSCVVFDSDFELMEDSSLTVFSSDGTAVSPPAQRGNNIFCIPLSLAHFINIYVVFTGLPQNKLT